ncbi:MerR family transcriptional regulator [Sphingomonas crusticola]|uniref:MerR family transcriptional regulator n=1 Tax=Sphingomonas crusticola TaxID=1697973 RepID=UPI000E2717E6|nr:MerR family transcriptional regulator [Sphingomonas crusticola]
MADPSAKAEGAFRTISEVAAELGLPQHILRYWETRFSQLRPLQRAGNRRYYRPADVALARRIHRLLNQEGYTMRGVQKLLAQPEQSQEGALPAASATESGGTNALIAIRDALTAALATDQSSRP